MHAERLGKQGDVAPVSDYLRARDSYLLPIKGPGEKNEITGLKDQESLYEADDGE